MDGLSLLLVDDNVLNQKLVFLILKKYNFIIDVAENGLDAIHKIKENSYDLVLMDLMMPVMDGLNATKQIRLFELNNGGHIPIIGLTANTYDADKEKCLACGMDAFMTKPFDVEVFIDIIKDLGI